MAGKSVRYEIINGLSSLTALAVTAMAFMPLHGYFMTAETEATGREAIHAGFQALGLFGIALVLTFGAVYAVTFLLLRALFSALKPQAKKQAQR